MAAFYLRGSRLGFFLVFDATNIDHVLRIADAVVVIAAAAAVVVQSLMSSELCFIQSSLVVASSLAPSHQTNITTPDRTRAPLVRQAVRSGLHWTSSLQNDLPIVPIPNAAQRSAAQPLSQCQSSRPSVTVPPVQSRPAQPLRRGQVSDGSASGYKGLPRGRRQD